MTVSTTEGDSEDPIDVGKQWEGYSNYQAVSRDMSMSISDALDSFSWIQSSQREGGQMNASDVADARADIVSAAIRVYVEMTEVDNRDDFEEILERWGGPNEDVEGRLDELLDISLYDDVPDWLDRFVVDLRTAGWRLGYLQAGRTSKARPDDDVEAEADNMFDGL